MEDAVIFKKSREWRHLNFNGPCLIHAARFRLYSLTEEFFWSICLLQTLRCPKIHTFQSKSEAPLKNDLIPFLRGLERILRKPYFKENREEILNNFRDAFSEGQLQSKQWLIDSLKKIRKTDLNSVFVCAGWYGILPFFLLRDRQITCKRIFLFDKDPLSVQISEDLNRDFVINGWKFKAAQKDILDIDYSNPSFETLKFNGRGEVLNIPVNTIINTSCEHIESFELWWKKIPEDKLLILQSNNDFSHPLHVHCAKDMQQFKEQCPLRQTLFEGSLDLGRYKRFLLIGFKHPAKE